MSPRQLTLSALTGCTLIRYETADGCAQNLDEREAARRIEYGDIKFRPMPGDITGDLVEPFLYHVLRLDPHRFCFDLPASVKGVGSSRTGHGGHGGGSREGFVFRRGGDGKPAGNPIGRLFFLSYDRKFAERDPTDRADFERLQ